jgi:Dolichyl-phosphate-mannose-protein mannosyltransferase
MSRRQRLRREAPALSLLSLILLVGLVLRIHNNGYGLPYVYYADEGSHFTNRAVEFFGGDWNPGYFQNPSAFTYVVHVVLALYFGHGLPWRGGQHVISLYSENPTRIYELGRATAAVLCLIGAGALYAIGRSLWDRRTGLVAAAVLTFAFLAVAYSRIAVTDTGTLLAVGLAVFCAIRLQEARPVPSWRWASGAGAATGLAIGFKYTAGLVLLSPLLALAWPLLDGRRDRATLRAIARSTVVLVVCALVVFAITTPYFFLDYSDAQRQLRAQADMAGGLSKYGQEHINGFGYYAGSLTWGLGWLPLVAALAGLVLLVRRGGGARAAVLAIFPLAMFVYLAVQQRYFGRWLLPAYPPLALAGAYAVVQGVGALTRLRLPRRLIPVALAVATVALVWQGAAAATRSDAVLGRTDTREAARAWLVANERPSLRAVIEPAVPARWYWRLRSNGSRVPRRKQFVRGFIRDIRETRIEYGRTLSPAVIDQYRQQGFCLVMTMSLIEGRSQAARDPRALAYYARLRRESTRVFHVSPYRAGATPQTFDFDRSYNYDSPSYERPGPEISIYRLDDCTQGYGTIHPGSGGTTA